MKAVLEGVALRAAEVMRAMSDLVPASGPLSIDGGLSRNPYFTQFLADVLERELSLASNAEVTGSGTAKLAATAVGRSVPARGDATTITPKVPRAHLALRFTDAVTLSRGWAAL